MMMGRNWKSSRAIFWFFILLATSSEAAVFSSNNSDESASSDSRNSRIPEHLKRGLSDYDDDELVPVLIGTHDDRGELLARLDDNDGDVTRLAGGVLASKVWKHRIATLQSEDSIDFVEWDALNFADDAGILALSAAVRILFMWSS